MRYSVPLIVTALSLASAPAFAQSASTPAAQPAAPATSAAPATGAAPAAAAPATTAAAPAVGAKVFGPDGAEVGTIEAVNGPNATLNTGTNRVGIPLTGFGTGPNGPTLGMTKAQLDAAATQTASQAGAALSTALQPGAAVHGVAGTQVGSVKGVEGDLVTVTTAKGDVRLPKSAFAVRDNGVAIGMSAADFDKAVTAANPR